MMLWLGAACLSAVAVSIVGLHTVFPVDGEPIQDGLTEPSASQEINSRPPSDHINPASLQRVASKNIRQQLFDPPIAVVKPPPPKPLPPIELISTILGDNGQHRAWVRDGQTLRKIVAGDTVGTDSNPATVVSIEVDRLVLQHETKQVEVSQQAGGGGRR